MRLHSSYSYFPLESNADVNHNVQTPNPSIERDRLSAAPHVQRCASSGVVT